MIQVNDFNWFQAAALWQWGVVIDQFGYLQWLVHRCSQVSFNEQWKCIIIISHAVLIDQSLLFLINVSDYCLLCFLSQGIESHNPPNCWRVWTCDTVGRPVQTQRHVFLTVRLSFSDLNSAPKIFDVENDFSYLHIPGLDARFRFFLVGSDVIVTCVWHWCRLAWRLKATRGDIQRKSVRSWTEKLICD